MTNHSSTPLSAEEKAQYKHWDLPDVSSNKSISSAAKEKQKIQPEKPEKKAEIDVDAGESVETTEEEITPLTAEQLQAITDAAEKEGYQAGQEQGFAEGKEAGYAAGYQEGLANAKQTITEQCERMQHIADALMVPLQTEHLYLETLLVDMVKQLATAVVKRELIDDSQHIVQLVDQALATMPMTADKYAVYLNSQDIELVEQHLHAIDKQFIFHIDDNLLPGGCRVETRSTAVDFSVEKRLTQVLDDFMHKRFAVGDSTPSLKDTSESTQEAAQTDKQSEKNQTTNRENETTEVIDHTKSESSTKTVTTATDANLDDNFATDSQSAKTTLSPLEKASLEKTEPQSNDKNIASVADKSTNDDQQDSPS